MSKQSEAKARQGFTKTLPMCSYCKHFSFIERKGGYQDNYIFQEKLRCDIGGFKVNKTTTCNEHRFK